MERDFSFGYKDGQFDELMISNMLGALGNPIIAKMMSEEELAVICKVVKTHVVSNANKILDKQRRNGQLEELRDFDDLSNIDLSDIKPLDDPFEADENFWLSGDNENKRGR